MPTFSQANRLISISTPLGVDVLLLVSINGDEGISKLFSYQLDMLAEAGATVAFDSLLGQPATVNIQEPDGSLRNLCGVISEFTEGGQVSGASGAATFTRFRAVLRPSFWLLSLTTRSRIFQQKTAKEILQAVFGSLNVSLVLSETYDAREYCIQYRETDLDFACRLMEEEGIFYFFAHTSSGDQLVLGDAPAAYAAVAAPTSIPYRTNTGNVNDLDAIDVWEKSQSLRPGKVTLRDYCFEMPDKDLQAQLTVAGTVQIGTVTHKLKVGGNDQFEVYEYPGRYAKFFDGVDKGGADQTSNLQKVFDTNARMARLRLQEKTAEGVWIRGEGNARNLTSGAQFTISGHFDANGSYVVRDLHQEATVGEAYTNGSAPAGYRNEFICLPAALPYRPPLTTPRPTVDGLQTAVVVGPSGQEIFTDKYGRIKVQFPWDRDGTSDANSSCWLRVATSWAGACWGSVHLPRIGQEVLVSFLDGDCDRPLVVGSVYNAAQMPPYTLPDNQTQSGLISRSSLNGDATAFNEFRFEDKKDSEDVILHAQLDYHTTVERDRFSEVDRDDTVTITRNRIETIKEGDETVSIEKGNRTETIKKGDETFTIETGNRTHKIKTDDSLTVEGKQTIAITGDLATTVSQGDLKTTVSQGAMTTTVSVGDHAVKISAGKGTVDAAQSHTTTVGGASIKIEPAAITLAMGPNSIKIEASGITISGVMTSVKGTAQVQVGAPIIQVSADGMLQLKGGVTMIN